MKSSKFLNIQGIVTNPPKISNLFYRVLIPHKVGYYFPKDLVGFFPKFYRILSQTAHSFSSLHIAYVLQTLQSYFLHLSQSSFFTPSSPRAFRSFVGIFPPIFPSKSAFQISP